MFTRYLLPLAAAGLLVFAVLHVVKAQQQKPPAVPPVTPAQAPFKDVVAGAGMVEAQTENVAVGSELAGVVAEVYVQEGDKVKAGDPLFRLDDRQLRAELAVRQAMLASARAQLEREERRPRAEELPPAKARVREAQANLANERDQLARTRNLAGSRAVSEEDLVKRQQAFRVAEAQLAKAQADLELIEAGAWGPDKAVARAAVAEADAKVRQTETDLQRLTVRARSPWRGRTVSPSTEDDWLEVMQVNVRPGEAVSNAPGQALILLGNVRRLHVRVDIDEQDIPRFRPGLPAKAMLRGDPRREFNLTFVRVEPYVVPKKSLTGDNTERVDTRVLQVLYAVEEKEPNLYVGQQLDVFIQTQPPGAGAPGR